MSRTLAEADVYRAIADPSRRILLDALVAGPRSFGDLHDLLPLTKGAVSQHLATLVRVGLVSVDEEDRSRRFALTPAPLEDVDDWLAAYRVFWEEKLDALDEALRRRRAERDATTRGDR